MSIRTLRSQRGRSIHRLAQAVALAGVFFIAGTTVALAVPGWTGSPVRKNAGTVEFELTPQGIVDGRFQVEVSASTHTVDLSKVNLQQGTELRIGSAVYAPIGPVPLAGHHGKARFEFPLASLPDAFEIVIRGVPGMREIVFRWP